MSEVALVAGEAAADEAVSYASLCKTVVHDAEQHGQSLCSEGYGGGASDCAGDVAYAIVDDAVDDVSGIVVVSLVAGFDAAGVIVGDVDENGARLHGLEHFLGDEEVLALLGPLDAVDYQVHLGQNGSDGLLVAEHGVDLAAVFLADLTEDAYVDVHDGDIGAQLMENPQCALAYGASAHDQSVDSGSAGEAADELALAAVDGEEGFQTEECALLTSCLAVGGAITMGVLCGDADALAVQQSLNFFRMSCGMDAAIDHLTFSGLLEFVGFDFLYLGDEIALFPDFVCGFSDDCALCRILLGGEAGTETAVFFCVNGVACCNYGCNFDRGADNSVFTLFGVL